MRAWVHSFRPGTPGPRPALVLMSCALSLHVLVCRAGITKFTSQRHPEVYSLRSVCKAQSPRPAQGCSITSAVSGTGLCVARWLCGTLPWCSPRAGRPLEMSLVLTNSRAPRGPKWGRGVASCLSHCHPPCCILLRKQSLQPPKQGSGALVSKHPDLAGEKLNRR